MTCAVIGDSIAGGLHMIAMRDCIAATHGGVSSGMYIQEFTGNVDTDLTVISLGANDVGIATLANLRVVRARISSRCVIWLLPNRRPVQRAAIETVAREHGDRMIDTAPYVGSDQLHPTADGQRAIGLQARAGCDG